MDIEDLLPQEGEEQKQDKKKVSPLVSLEKDLELYTESIKEIAGEIIAEGISQHPIFVAHQHTVSIGEMILNKDELNTNWTIQASMMEEFIEKGIIKPELRELFLKSYKKPQEFMCVFVIVPEGANFIYYPYHLKDR
jgi:hypothetical protein